MCWSKKIFTSNLNVLFPLNSFIANGIKIIKKVPKKVKSEENNLHKIDSTQTTIHINKANEGNLKQNNYDLTNLLILNLTNLSWKCGF